MFPYLKKRIQVVKQQSTEMNPIEVAIDEMSRKVSELNQLCKMDEVDMIRLQLKLQGSVSVKVHTRIHTYTCTHTYKTILKTHLQLQFSNVTPYLLGPFFDHK